MSENTAPPSPKAWDPTIETESELDAIMPPDAKGSSNGGPKAESRSARPTKAGRAVAYVDEMIAESFATPAGDPFIDVLDSDAVRRTLRVRSRETRTLLDRVMYEREEIPLGSRARQDALDVLDARARHSSVVRDVHVRVAEHQDIIYLDLADPTWRAIRITRDGWSVVSSRHVPVRFRRPRGIRGLPVPIPGGTIHELQRFVSTADDSFVLIIAWLLGALRSRGPYAVLVLHGEQGSAKSTTARLVRALVDPHDVPLRAPPRDERDVMIAAHNAHVVALDNVSYLQPWLSDALCRVATGGGFATRELYTDAEELILSATRPMILTGIEDVAARGDLADRCYSVELHRISDADRKTERELDAAFGEAAPRILGALLDTVVYGLAHERDIRDGRLPRMADAARWVLACEPRCPWPAGEYLKAYSGTREEIIALGIAGDTVAQAVVDHVDRHNGEWIGTAGDLLKELNRVRGDARAPRHWPDTARAFSGRLTRAAPLLRGGGIEMSRPPREPGTGRRILSLTWASHRHDRHNRHPNNTDNEFAPDDTVTIPLTPGATVTATVTGKPLSHKTRDSGDGSGGTAQPISLWADHDGFTECGEAL